MNDKNDKIDKIDYYEEMRRELERQRREDPTSTHREALDAVVRVLATVPHNVRVRVVGAAAVFYDLNSADEPGDGEECDCEEDSSNG